MIAEAGAGDRLRQPTEAGERALLTVLAFVSFAFVYNNVVIAPILLGIAGDFGTTTGMAGLLVVAYSGPSVLVAHVLGSLSDRSSRRPFLIAGALITGLGTLAGALAPSFDLLMATRAVSGLGVAMLVPNLNAILSDAFSYRERGRAVAHTISAQTLATIAGVPLAGIVADLLSWRWSLTIVGALTLASVYVLVRHLPEEERRPGTPRMPALYRGLFSDRSAVAGILSAFLGSAFWFTWIAYFVAFFQRTYDLSASVASLLGITAGAGILVGNNVGGRLGDLVGHKRVLATALLVAGLLVIAITSLPLSILAAAILNFALCAASGARMPTNSAMLGEQLPVARATMFGVTWSAISVGVVLGTGSAGYLVDAFGFGALGVVAGAAALLSAVVVTLFVREERDPAPLV